MARPVVVVVDAEDASRQALARQLEGRYGADYRIISSASPEEALTGLEQLRTEGALAKRTSACQVSVMCQFGGRIVPSLLVAEEPLEFFCRRLPIWPRRQMGEIWIF